MKRIIKRVIGIALIGLLILIEAALACVILGKPIEIAVKVAHIGMFGVLIVWVTARLIEFIDYLMWS